jgi:hypothetical protein
MDKAVPRIRKIHRTPKARLKDQGKWAVFNIDTKFRLTEYTTRGLAELARRSIIFDQPDLRGKVAIKQKSFEKQ